MIFIKHSNLDLQPINTWGMQRPHTGVIFWNKFLI